MKKFIFIVIFAVYLAILFKITVFRNTFNIIHTFENGQINLMPFIDLVNIFKNQGILRFLYLFVGNIVWFIPFGYLLPKIVNIQINIFQIAIYGFCLSFLIEFLQFVFGTGISEVDDLILNILGAVLGFIAYTRTTIS